MMCTLKHPGSSNKSLTNEQVNWLVTEKTDQVRSFLRNQEVEETPADSWTRWQSLVELCRWRNTEEAVAGERNTESPRSCHLGRSTLHDPRKDLRKKYGSFTDEWTCSRQLTRKPSCRWRTRATLAKSLHSLRKSSGVVSCICIASLPIDSVPTVSY